MNRREAAFALAGLGLPPLAFAQAPGKKWRVGLLAAIARPPVVITDPSIPFGKEMRALGYVEGKNIEYELRYASEQAVLLDTYAAELVASKVDVIVTITTPPTLAAKRATNTIPVVFITVADPVGIGLSNSLARPSANFTGLSNITLELSLKQFELLREILPSATNIAVLANPNNPASRRQLEMIQSTASGSRVRIFALLARSGAEIGQALTGLTKNRIEGAVVTADAILFQHHEQISTLLAKEQIPAIYPQREFVHKGGLASYGANVLILQTRAAQMVDRILKGAKPSDIPIEMSTDIELAVNIKVARSLGITLPKSVLARANELIE